MVKKWSVIGLLVVFVWGFSLADTWAEFTWEPDPAEVEEAEPETLDEPIETYYECPICLEHLPEGIIHLCPGLPEDEYEMEEDSDGYYQCPVCLQELPEGILHVCSGLPEDEAETIADTGGSYECPYCLQEVLEGAIHPCPGLSEDLADDDAGCEDIWVGDEIWEEEVAEEEIEEICTHCGLNHDQATSQQVMQCLDSQITEDQAEREESEVFEE
ncbi:MAG: hypothetical protein ABIH45_02795 [Candidatus Omnitrophota bacterium]